MFEEDDLLNKNENGDEFRIIQKDDTPPEKFTIYLNSGESTYGIKLVDISRSHKLLFDTVDVYKCTPPSWLPGTPTVTTSDNVYCGVDAEKFIKRACSKTISLEKEQKEKLEYAIRKDIENGTFDIDAFFPKLSRSEEMGPSPNLI